MTTRSRTLDVLLILAAVALISGAAMAQTFNPDGAAHDPTKQSGWALPPVDKSTADYNNCLRCHQQGGPSGAADVSAYLLGGHKNMSRLADGKPWGMPGVDSAHAASAGLSEASLDTNGRFTNLWIQEDYVRPVVDWITKSGSASSSFNGGYCAKSAAGDIGTDDVPDLAACPTCESPVMGNGNAGYPLNYPDAVTCAAAALHTGKPYTWIPLNGQPLYFIYGGAGLEGGPAMIQRGSQQYKCGRCHTTGWTANTANDAAVAGQTKRPYSDFPSAALASVTTLGATSKLLGPSFGAAAYAVVKSPCTAGVDCDVTSVVLTAKGALFPPNTSATVTLSDSAGTGCTATANMAPDAYATTNKVNSVDVNCSASNHSYTSGTKVAISHPYSVSSWDQWGIQCSRCHSNAVDGKHGNDTFANVKGGDIVAMCMTCHRQESDTAPRAVQGGNGFAANNGFVLPYTNKQQQPDGFAHHPDGNEFVNSPHAKLTGNWKDIGCPPYAIFGYNGVDAGKPGAPATGSGCTAGTMNLDGNTPSNYGSKFAQAAKVDLKGISDAAAGSCATCHDVHKPLNENTDGMGGSVKTACTDCHSNPSAKVSPQVFVGAIRHIGGPNTPLANAVAEPSSACVVCHQPPGIKHLWRISTDPNYTMYGDYTYAFPVNGQAAQSTGSNAPGLVNLSNFAPDGSYKNAMWVDLDNACGQCHGGGVSPVEVETTGSITAGGANGSINPLTVADVFGFASGKSVTIAGAGWAGADFTTIIAKVVPDASSRSGTVYLTYPAVTTVKNAVVTVEGNAHIPEAPYFTRTQLAAAAQGMHGVSLLTADISWSRSENTYTFGLQNMLCPDEPCSIAWDFGDGTKATGATTSHTYSGFGNYVVGATLTDAVGARATSTASLNVGPSSAHPYANNTDKTWTYTAGGNPASINVSFDGRTAVEPGYDFIYVTDKNGNNVSGSPFTGTSLAGKTINVPGDTVKIRLKSDLSITGWGFEARVGQPGATGTLTKSTERQRSIQLRSRPVSTRKRAHSGD